MGIFGDVQVSAFGFLSVWIVGDAKDVHTWFGFAESLLLIGIGTSASANFAGEPELNAIFCCFLLGHPSKPTCKPKNFCLPKPSNICLSKKTSYHHCPHGEGRRLFASPTNHLQNPYISIVCKPTISLMDQKCLLYLRATFIFALNELNGRVLMSDGSLGGPWNYSNADIF
ncbi:hypothetical protein IEQ34_003146 [Dendrobium chrysotoxum]|uniref:Uncharacterized protein n=1 Tax=Dendrobium chrysotoxum TaxID=161865 RepID=A0AAV7HKH5_DENCH|nr:hypothetical protein IEQ34_003146 [Dendrobium chrysotoxum]